MQLYLMSMLKARCSLVAMLQAGCLDSFDDKNSAVVDMATQCCSTCLADICLTDAEISDKYILQ